MMTDQTGLPHGWQLVPGEPDDAWAERFCAAVNWHPDGEEHKVVEGILRSTTFRNLAKAYIRIVLAEALKAPALNAGGEGDGALGGGSNAYPATQPDFPKPEGGVPPREAD